MTGTRPLIEGPAQLTTVNPNSITFVVLAPGLITVRAHYSPRWAPQGSGCVRATPQGWTQILASSAGPTRLYQRVGPNGPTNCEPHSA